MQAEKAAWALANEQGLDLVTILPEFIMGPVLTLAAAESSLSSGFFKARLQHLVLCFGHRRVPINRGLTV